MAYLIAKKGLPINTSTDLDGRLTFNYDPIFYRSFGTRAEAVAMMKRLNAKGFLGFKVVKIGG